MSLILQFTAFILLVVGMCIATYASIAQNAKYEAVDSCEYRAEGTCLDDWTGAERAKYLKNLNN